jgi:FtsH-binding integral membrane protein
MSTASYAGDLTPARTQTLFGRVMGLVALTTGFATLGVYVAREMGGAGWFIAWLIAFGCLFGLNAANARGNHRLALMLLFAFGLLLGAGISTTVNYYSATDPTAVRQALGATALFVGGLGAGGYAIRRDLSFLYRTLFWLLLGLILAGIVLIFVRIPALYTVYAHGLRAARARDLWPLHSGRLQPPAPCRNRGSDPAGSGDLPRCAEHLPFVFAAVRPILLGPTPDSRDPYAAYLIAETSGRPNAPENAPDRIRTCDPRIISRQAAFLRLLAGDPPSLNEQLLDPPALPPSAPLC